MRALILAVVLLSSGARSVASAQPVPDPSQIQQSGPRSGFWTSNAPAKGGAYRWRLLGIGVALLGGSGILMIRLVRRAKRERAAGTAVPRPR